MLEKLNFGIEEVTFLNIVNKLIIKKPQTTT
jgi:hypothetical protein